MTRRRTSLFVLLLAAIAVAVALGVPTLRSASDRPQPAGDATNGTTIQAFANIDDPLLQRLAIHAVARAENDRATLLELAGGTDVASLRAARDLAFDDELPADLRRFAIERVLALRIDEPLARRERLELQLAHARASEEAGNVDAALAGFREALPDERAIAAVERLEEDPYRRANAFLQARLHREALEALGGRAAPSIEAPALRALGRHEEGLDAYRRWLDEVPGDAEALAGLAWSHWFLGDLEAAEGAFERLGGPTGAYGRALIANRRGELDEAVRLLVSTGDARRLWLATSLLEGAERWSEAVDVYLRIAEGDSVYADDAAWRVRVLGERFDRPDWTASGNAALPPDGWFALRTGARAPGPSRADLPVLRPDAIDAARALAEVDDVEGARLVLAFALRDAIEAPTGADAPAPSDPVTREATIVALGEALGALGEYRQPQRAVAPLVAEGSEQLRTWRLAYPEAWPEHVRLEAKEAGVDPHLVWAVMRRESAFFPEAISRSGAQGLMQVMPATWDWLAEIQDEQPADPFDVADNIRYGITYLGWLDDYFDGEELLVVPSYNRGQGYIGRLYASPEVRRDADELIRSIDALETREYLQAVLHSKHVYDALAEAELRFR